MIYRVGISSNTTDATSGTGTAYPSGAHEFIHGFSGVRVPPSFSVVFCRSLFVHFPLSVVLSVPLRHTSSDYPPLYHQTLLTEQASLKLFVKQPSDFSLHNWCCWFICVFIVNTGSGPGQPMLDMWSYREYIGLNLSETSELIKSNRHHHMT